MLQSLDDQLSAIDWIKSPFDVPMPTQRDVSPEEPLGALGRTRVDVDSRMKELDATGPVLNAGPMAPFTEVAASATMAERICFEEGMVSMVVYKSSVKGSCIELLKDCWQTAWSYS